MERPINRGLSRCTRRTQDERIITTARAHSATLGNRISVYDMRAVAKERTAIGELQYRGQRGWQPLPDWARFMLDVGARVASDRTEDGRLVVALSLPVRSFAAALAGASAVATAFRHRPPASDSSEHFDYLASLPPGTAISHHRVNSVEQGRLVGLEMGHDGVARIRIKMRKEDRSLPVSLCTEIQVIDEPGRLKVGRQRLVRNPAFLSHALPGMDITALSANTRLDCVIIGVQHTLEAELLAKEFGAGEHDHIYDGSLQGIARARNVVGTKDAYRSAIVAVNAEDGQAPVTSFAPLVTIYDGARAYNNWRSHWRESNWLVLLDRGSPSVAQGAAAINQAYATRLRGSETLAGLDVPPSVETLAYVERR